MGSAGYTTVGVDISQCILQVGIYFLIAEEAAGVLGSVSIGIDADGKNVVGVVGNVVETVFPVERVQLLTIQEQNLIVGVFCHIQLALIGIDILNSQRADIPPHIAHKGVDGAGLGIVAVPVQRVHMAGQLIVLLERQSLGCLLGQFLGFTVLEAG